MARSLPLCIFVCLCASALYSQDLAGIEIHGFATQGFLFSSQNNYLAMKSSSGSLQWTDGAVSVSDSLTDSLRVGIQLHMYQLGSLGGPNIQVDWASGDYRINDYVGIRAGKSQNRSGIVQRFAGRGRGIFVDSAAPIRLPHRQQKCLPVPPWG